MVSSNLSHAERGKIDDLEGIAQIERLAWWPRFFTNIVCALLALFFTWLQIKEYEIAQIVEYAKPDLIFKFALVMYYFCWLFGPAFDLKIQQTVYIRDPAQGEVKPLAFLLLVLFSGSAFFLMWASNNEKTFSLALAIFFTLNVLGYAYIVRRTKPAVAESSKLYLERANYYRFEQLLAVTRYMFGRWQRIRFAVLGVIVTGIDAICLSDAARLWLSGHVHSIYSDIPVDALSNLLPDLSLLFFVCVSEGWIWAERLRVRNSVMFIDDLRRKYSIAPLLS
jgi:hypothetical protein